MDDPGDLQMASLAGGIMHPPGYSLLVSIGWLLTRIGPLHDPFTITVVCHACMLGVLGLVAAWQVLLGAPAWWAALTSLLLTLHPSVQEALLLPEVYAPSLLIWLSVVALSWLAARTGRAHLVVAALLAFGAAASLRPPLMVAGLLPALVIWTWWRRSRPRAATVVVWLTVFSAALALGPVLHLVSIIRADRPSTAYNCLQQHTVEFDVPPARDGTFARRLQRALWWTSGAQFRELVSLDPAKLVRRQMELTQSVSGEPWALAAPAWLVAGTVGLCAAWRRSPWLAGGLLLTGVVNYAYLSVYHVRGTAADVLPVLVVSSVGVGVLVGAAAGRFPAPSSRFTTYGALALVVVAALGYLPGIAAQAARSNQVYDGRAAAGLLNWQALPPGSVVFTQWPLYAPLEHARVVVSKRQDLHIRLVGLGNMSAAMKAAYEARLNTASQIWTTSYVQPPAGFTLTEFSDAWLLEPAIE